MRIRFRCLIFIALVTTAIVPRVVSADLVKLNNGGELRGKLRLRAPKPKLVVVETLSGTVVAVAQQDVQFITRRTLRVEEYETLAKRLPNTIDDHSRTADWCRKHGLKTQREHHLRQILEIDPDHKVTRLALGYGKYNNRWMTRDEWNRSRGLVKYKGRYITPEEFDLIKKSNAELAREREWFRKVRLWKTWLKSTFPNRRQAGLAELQRIQDPDAVAALTRNFGSESNARMRTLLLTILSKMKGPKPVASLTNLVLHDGNSQIRYEALNAISKPQYPIATPYFVAALKNESVVIVRRAADGLRRVGDQRAVKPLIAALQTTHRYKVRVPRKSVGFNSNGSFAGQSALPPQVELMLRSGQFPNGVIVQQPQVNPIATKLVRIRYTHKNSEVLAALQSITGQSFGFNDRDWRLWLASSKNKQGVKSP